MVTKKANVGGCEAYPAFDLDIEGDWDFTPNFDVVEIEEELIQEYREAYTRLFAAEFAIIKYLRDTNQHILEELDSVYPKEEDE